MLTPTTDTPRMSEGRLDRVRRRVAEAVLVFGGDLRDEPPRLAAFYREFVVLHGPLVDKGIAAMRRLKPRSWKRRMAKIVVPIDCGELSECPAATFDQNGQYVNGLVSLGFEQGWQGGFDIHPEMKHRAGLNNTMWIWLGAIWHRKLLQHGVQGLPGPFPDEWHLGFRMSPTETV